MFPSLLEIGGVSLSSYGFFWICGYGAAMALILFLAHKRGQDELYIFSNACLLALSSGLIGARALFVLTNFSHFASHPTEVFFFWQGGLVFLGGVFAAIPLCYFYFKNHKISPSLGFDLLAPGLAIGQAFGRIGCLAAGCCHGKYCDMPWAIHLHSNLVEPYLRGLPIHPTQIYESVGLFFLAGFLALTQVKKWREGAGFQLYFMGYGMLRFVVEFFRGDSIRGEIPWLSLSTSQVLGLLLFFCGGIFWIRDFRRYR